jgi:hypothetical protein
MRHSRHRLLTDFEEDFSRNLTSHVAPGFLPERTGGREGRICCYIGLIACYSLSVGGHCQSATPDVCRQPKHVAKLLTVMALEVFD